MIFIPKNNIDCVMFLPFINNNANDVNKRGSANTVTNNNTTFSNGDAVFDGIDAYLDIVTFNLIPSSNFTIWIEFTHTTKVSDHWVMQTYGTDINIGIDSSDLLTIVHPLAQITNYSITSGNRYGVLIQQVGAFRQSILYDSNYGILSRAGGSSTPSVITGVTIGAKIDKTGDFLGSVHNVLFNNSGALGYSGRFIPNLD